ncbi:ankyrin repeat domain-containing protein [Alkalimarinus coralli]|uniref:ankyrin repeat domain-containing protein n=1 Tax=Alkalimarinus coralli TaxID=2935863 RepID=UPI00202B806A|nr:ankyrin repeat domain-containing protein [Alkalimarinus coralli]
MKNRITTAIVITALLSFSLTGCGMLSGGQDADNQSDAASADASVTSQSQPATANEPTALMLSAAEGDLSELKDLVEQGANVNTLTPEGTALSYAIEKNQQIPALYLMSVGADPNKGFTDGDASLLMVAADRADNRLVKALLAAGADVNYADAQGETAIAYASYKGHLTTVKALLKAGADVNVTPEGKSLLMHIVKNNDLLLAQVVIAAGADVNYADEHGNTALKIAQEKGLADLEMLLIQSGATS